MNNEITLSLITLIKILLWGYLKHIVTHLEPNWLDLLCYIFTLLLDMAESFVTFAIKFGKGGLPFYTNLLENIWGNGELGTASIDNGWVAGVLTYLLHCFRSIGHSLSFESPSSKPVGEVLKSLEAICTVDNLR